MTIEEQIQEREQKSAVIGKAVGAMLPPSVGYAVALGSLGRYHMGAEGALIGGLLGYFIGSKTAHDPEARRSIIQEIMSGGARPGNGIGGNADTSSGIMSARELMNYTYQRYGFDGRWGDFVGQPSVNFHAMIFGRPKQGKSILSVQWAKYLSENFGRVLYVASEEGFSVTLQKKVVEFAMDNPRLDFANFRDFTQIREAVNAGNYQFVFIDSVNFIKITPEDVEEIKAENPATAFITIQQATKNGNFRGSQEFAHNCDMVIRVEAGVAHHQGRFQEGTEMAIFDGPEKPSNGAKTETPKTNGVETSALGGSEMGYSDGYTNGDQLALF